MEESREGEETDARRSINKSLELIAMTLFPTPISSPLKGDITNMETLSQAKVTPH